MRLLAVDSSSENLSLCAMSGDSLLFNVNRRIRFGASQLIVYIERYLKKINKDIKYFDALVVGSGPGSFTGLRISFSVMKAFSLSTGIPIISFSSFLSCAEQIKNKSDKITVLADARKNLLYRGNFQVKNGVIKNKEKIKLVSFDDIERGADSLFTTYDSHIRKELQDRFADIKFYSKDIYPKARYLLNSARERYMKKLYTPLNELEPLYIHPKTCQIRRKQ